MKRNCKYISFILLGLWLMASSKEFYLPYCIQLIKAQQHAFINSHKKAQSTRFKTLTLPVGSTEITFEESDEFYYHDTLYDIIETKYLPGNLVEYKLISDNLEQTILSFLLGNNLENSGNNLAIDFNYKFIASFSENELFYSPLKVIPLSSGYPETNFNYYFLFENKMLQPPD